MRPQPNNGSHPAVPLSSQVIFRICSSCAAVSNGLYDFIRHAKPPTCGVAIEVPDCTPTEGNPVVYWLSLHRPKISAPGALRSISGPLLEKPAWPSKRSVAPTPMHLGYFAGQAMMPGAW